MDNGRFAGVGVGFGGGVFFLIILIILLLIIFPFGGVY
ncbi:hypothetical protein HVS_07080 [Acetivibrio saccincola]|uniref:Uncharacterized protein n=1 Tax=Acetivibrio saccincola TaxID=1677857 RepID=A0A2K9EHB1_9FIRM|nr:hypothetical protein HVS_07080 [Acetivibrio saccincola]